ncbi:MAG TPA: hypothetical protein VKA91_09175 [Nitrososphaeraceae archaeon]|nr:hypothetical protein [Nitrososphaeraceae archaeon]
MNDASANEKERAASPAALPLKIIEDVLYNRITQKKEEVHNKTKNIAENDKLCLLRL